MTGQRAREEPVSLLRATLPPWVEVRVFAIAPGETRIYDPAEWHGAIVVVERGAIDLEGLSGRRWRFRQGDVLYLADLPLRALCNEGAEAALLSALSRTKQTVAAHS